MVVDEEEEAGGGRGGKGSDKAAGCRGVWTCLEACTKQRECREMSSCCVSHVRKRLVIKRRKRRRKIIILFFLLEQKLFYIAPPAPQSETGQQTHKHGLGGATPCTQALSADAAAPEGAHPKFFFSLHNTNTFFHHRFFHEHITSSSCRAGVLGYVLPR